MTGERDWESRDRVQDGENIKDRVAFPGKVEGTAFVVSEENPLEEFPGDQILVPPMFKPDMTHVALSKRPLAIVTDLGGIVTHGAIFARESKIPMIVACQNATGKIPFGAKIMFDAKERGEGLIKIFDEERIKNG